MNSLTREVLERARIANTRAPFDVLIVAAEAVQATVIERDDLRALLVAVLPILEHDMPPAPDHGCGPHSGVCGGECVDYARASDLLRRVRDAVRP